MATEIHTLQARRRAAIALAVAVSSSLVLLPALGATAQETPPPDDGATTTTHTSKEPGTGNPTRILFAVTWETYDGVVHTSMPPEGLDAGWGTSFLLEGTSSKGVATCSYEVGSTTLTCDYDNPGHGSEPGLVVPGNPEATYIVSVSGLPTGWRVDPATVGTFVGRETCPRGGDGHDGGHGEELLPAAEHEGGHTCTHVVALVQDPPPPTTPTSTTTTTTAAGPAAAVADAGAARAVVGPAPAFTG